MNYLKLSLVTVSLLVLGTNVTKAQAFDEGKSVVTIGYCYPNLVKSILKTSVENANSSANSSGLNTSTVKVDVTGMGPILGKYEYGLSKVVGIGGVIGYSTANFTVSDTYEDTYYDNTSGTYQTGIYTDVAKLAYSSLSIGARVNFHFSVKDKLDPYAGIAAGYSANSFKFSYSSTNPNYTEPSSTTVSGLPVYFGLTIGMRYYFSDNIGMYGELGIDKASVMQGGIAFKF